MEFPQKLYFWMDIFNGKKFETKNLTLKIYKNLIIDSLKVRL